MWQGLPEGVIKVKIHLTLYLHIKIFKAFILDSRLLAAVTK